MILSRPRTLVSTIIFTLAVLAALMLESCVSRDQHRTPENSPALFIDFMREKLPAGSDFAIFKKFIKYEHMAITAETRERDGARRLTLAKGFPGDKLVCASWTIYYYVALSPKGRVQSVVEGRSEGECV